MKKTAIQRCVFLLLAGALLWSVWVWSRTPLDAGTVVTEDLRVLSGQDNWRDFYHATRTGRPASIHLTTRYLADERLLRPEDAIYEEDLIFDGKVYTISGETGGVDNGPYEWIFQYLLYFPDEPSPSPSSLYETATYYVLADDNTLTYQDIWRSMISSSMKDHVRCRTVYSAYNWREELFLEEDLI